MTQTVCDCCKKVVNEPLRFTVTGKGAPPRSMSLMYPSYDRAQDQPYFDICRACVDVFLEMVGEKPVPPHKSISETMVNR
jgi:hypothetical protein